MIINSETVTFNIDARLKESDSIFQGTYLLELIIGCRLYWLLWGNEKKKAY